MADISVSDISVNNSIGTSAHFFIGIRLCLQLPTVWPCLFAETRESAPPGNMKSIGLIPRWHICTTTSDFDEVLFRDIGVIVVRDVLWIVSKYSRYIPSQITRVGGLGMLGHTMSGKALFAWRIFQHHFPGEFVPLVFLTPPVKC